VPDVSIVTAVYRPRFLSETWEAVREQRGIDWEWVVQVDGTEAEAREWVPAEMRGDERVRVEARGHFGIAVTRNLGLLRTHADFVQTLDHDDLLEADALAALADELRADESLAFTFGEHMILLPDGTLEPRPEVKRMPPGRIEPGVVVERWRTGPHGMVPNATMWRKDYLYAYGGWTALPVGDDYGLMFAVADRHPVSFVDRVVLKYRRYPEQSSSDDLRQAQVDVQRPFVFGRVEAMRRISGK
jgi:glycosyltransferase involved in cell wall biosynthesis